MVVWVCASYTCLGEHNLAEVLSQSRDLISAEAFLQHQQKQSSLLQALVLCYNTFFETSYFRCGCWDVREHFWEVSAL